MIVNIQEDWFGKEFTALVQLFRCQVSNIGIIGNVRSPVYSTIVCSVGNLRIAKGKSPKYGQVIQCQISKNFEVAMINPLIAWSLWA